MRVAIALLCCGIVWAQQSQQTDQDDLRTRLSEAGNSTPEFSRALEAHLKKFPASSQKAEVERTLFRAAIELKDNERVVKYGAAILATDPEDMQALEFTSRALLVSDSKEAATQALVFAKQFEKVLRNLEPKPGAEPLRWQQRAELDQSMGRALVFQSRAVGNLGQVEEALKLAKTSFEANGSAEAAREQARWLGKLNKFDEAAESFALGYALAANDAERERDLKLLRETWKKGHPDETGAGDKLIIGFDKATQMRAARKAKLQAIDPNALETDAMRYTLPGVAGIKLPLGSLKGKVVIMDFWATWCGPCRTQHPLYEVVKQKFKGRDDVVFLAIATDEEPTLVEPFLTAQKWSKQVYFESGLSRLLSVSSIPTTVIFNKKGEVASRMNGFVPERFVDSLTDRIQQILAE